MSLAPENPINNLCSLREVELSNSELSFVTAIDIKNKTFFAQLCKFTNQELVEFNRAINIFCKLVSNSDEKAQYIPNKIQKGDVFCTKWREDSAWYRVRIVDCDNGARKCTVQFVDYGNLEDLNYEELIYVSPQKEPRIERSPFGVICNLNGMEKLNDAYCAILLKTMYEDYAMIKPLEKLDSNRWLINLPKVAYNSSIWISYQLHKLRLQGKPITQTNEELLAAAIDA